MGHHCLGQYHHILYRAFDLKRRNQYPCGGRGFVFYYLPVTGPEVGGSVNVPFYLAQSISVAFYIFAFTEGWLSIRPQAPEVLVLFVAFAACYLVAYTSVGLASRLRFPILFIVMFSLFSVFLGSFPILGQAGAIYTPQLIGAYPSASFWQVFAIFFPAVTGVLAGVNLSGTLSAPRRSIPLGTMTAIVVSFVIYMCLAYWTSVVATPEELVTNFTIMVDKAAFGWAVQIGILAATFSAALNSLLGAPAHPAGDGRPRCRSFQWKTQW